MRIKKKLTIYNYYGFEADFLKYLIYEAGQRGFEIRITSDINEKSDIGIYMQHFELEKDKNLTINSKLSIFIFHDLMELHSEWPNKWLFDRWDIFDIAIIPNCDWKKRWEKCSWSNQANPKIGVYELGWPKVDHIFQRREQFIQERSIFLNKLNLKHKNTIFYAPSYEIENKQGRVIELLKDMPVNIIIKQAFDNTETEEFYKNIKEANEKYEGKYDNVYILDPKTDIQLCFSITDIIISDESSVMVESLLFDIPSISVLEWNVGFGNQKNKPLVPFNWIYTIEKENDIENKIKELLKDKENVIKRLSNIKKQYFSNIGTTSSKILNLIDKIILDEDTTMLNKLQTKNNIYDKKEIEKRFTIFLESLNIQEKKIAIKLKKYFLNFYLYIVNNYNDIKNLNYIIWGASTAGNIVYKLMKNLFPNFKFQYYVDKFKSGSLNGFEIKSVDIINNNINEFVIIATKPGKCEAMSKLYRLNKEIGKDFLAL